MRDSGGYLSSMEEILDVHGNLEPGLTDMVIRALCIQAFGARWTGILHEGILQKPFTTGVSEPSRPTGTTQQGRPRTTQFSEFQ